MIDRQKCSLLGTLAKTQGIDGSLVLRLSEFKTDEIEEPESVFIEIDGLLVPFFIDRLREKSSGEFIVKFIDVDSIEQATHLTGCRAFVAGSQSMHRKSPLAEKNIMDYRVVDTRLGFIGTASEIIDLAQNPLLKVIAEKQEYLIPFHPDIVREIDNKKKIITIESPDGLLEI